MKKRILSAIIILTMMLFLSSCKEILSTKKVESRALASDNSDGKQKLKIEKAGDISVVPSLTIKTQDRKGDPPKVENQNVNPPKPEKTVFKLGDKDDKVKEIQQKLNKFKYGLIEDGQFGEATDFAVRDFQLKHKVAVNGIINPDMMKLLNSEPTEATIYKPVAQPVISSSVISKAAYYENIVNKTDCASYNNYLIMVILAEQKVYVFNGNNHNWKLINTFACASGRPETPTITGHFYVGNKGPAFVTANGLVCKYFTQISGNYLFHSILYDKNGKVVDSTLGAKASHGCVRLAIENAKYIYDNIPAGAGIWIY